MNTTPATATDPRETRLPGWAQQALRQARANERAALDELARHTGTAPTAVAADPFSIDRGRPATYLDPAVPVRYAIGNNDALNTREFIDTSFDLDTPDTVIIRASYALVVEPEASNTIRVRFRQQR